MQQNNGNVAKILIVGIGGGGGNAIDTMLQSRIQGVDLLAMNTDVQALSKIGCETFTIGEKLTQGLGAGANPDIGKKAAEESEEAIRARLKGLNMLFIAAGMGGGTGTGAAPVVARIAKEMEILTIAVVTKPFNFEGIVRMKNAEKGIENLKDNVDSLVIVQNEKLNQNKNFSLMDAFLMADEILLQGIRGIADIISQGGRINLDLSDVKKVMANSGMAHMGTGVGRGEHKVISAIKEAVSSPLLETTIEGASSIIINFCGGKSVLLSEINTGVDLVRQVIDQDANVLFGYRLDESLEDTVKVTLIATGFAKRSFASNVSEPVARPAVANNNVNNANVATTYATANNMNGSIDIEEDADIPPFLRRMKGE